jgi:hypothetical protein
MERMRATGERPRGLVHAPDLGAAQQELLSNPVAGTTSWTGNGGDDPLISSCMSPKGDSLHTHTARYAAVTYRSASEGDTEHAHTIEAHRVAAWAVTT